MNQFLQSGCSIYLLCPWLTLPDLYQLKQVCRLCERWVRYTTRDGAVNRMIKHNLLRLVDGNNEVLRYLLSLWEDTPPHCNLFLTGSALLWCLDPSDKWRPNDIDLVVFQPSPALFPFFLDEKLERQGASAHKERRATGQAWMSMGNSGRTFGGVVEIEDESYLRLFWSCFPRERRFAQEWKRIRCNLHAPTIPTMERKDEKDDEAKYGVDVILRLGDTKNQAWDHLQGFDLSFLQNAWDAKSGILECFDMPAIAYKEAIHRFPQPHDRDVVRYWERRAQKFRDRGYRIIASEFRVRLENKRKRDRE